MWPLTDRGGGHVRGSHGKVSSKTRVSIERHLKVMDPLLHVRDSHSANSAPVDSPYESEIASRLSASK